MHPPAVESIWVVVLWSIVNLHRIHLLRGAYIFWMQSSEFKYNKQLFTEKARKWTQEHAVQKNTVSALVYGWSCLLLFMIENFFLFNTCNFIMYWPSQYAAVFLLGDMIIVTCSTALWVLAYFSHRVVLCSLDRMLCTHLISISNKVMQSVWFILISNLHISYFLSFWMWGANMGNAFIIFVSVFVQGVVGCNRENTADQKASSRKREAFCAQQEAEEPAKRTCV